MAHEVPVGLAVGAEEPPLSSDEVYEHDAVEELVRIIAGPFWFIFRVGLFQASLYAVKDFSVILEELLRNPLDAESSLVAPPDLVGVVDVMGLDTAENLQIGAVWLLPLYLKDPQPKAYLPGISRIGQAPGGYKCKVVIKAFRGKDEEILALGLVSIEGVQETANIRSANSGVAKPNVKNAKRGNVSHMDHLMHGSDHFPCTLGQVPDVHGQRLHYWVAEVCEEGSCTFQGSVLLQDISDSFKVVHAHSLQSQT
ncbi:MAG: hypothetical protein H5U03_04445 [Clostridia bacterium]|nr:hypothetical protein [Clostridia bacterium]